MSAAAGQSHILGSGPGLVGVSHSRLTASVFRSEFAVRHSMPAFPPRRRQAERGGGSGTPVRRLHVSLKQLILANLIEPGPSAVELRYKGMAFPASLERDGKISFEGSSFATASAFSIHVIR